MYKKVINLLILLFLVFAFTACSNDISQYEDNGELTITLSKGEITSNSIDTDSATNFHRKKEEVLNNLVGYRIRVTNSNGLKVFKDVVFPDGEDTITVKLSLPANSGYKISALAMIGKGEDSDRDGIIDDYSNSSDVFVGGYGEIEGVVISSEESNSVNIKMAAIQYDYSSHPSEVTTGEVYNLTTIIIGLSKDTKLVFPGIFRSFNKDELSIFENRIYGDYEDGNISIEDITAPGEEKNMYYGIRGRLDDFKYDSDDAIFTDFPYIIYPAPVLNESPLEIYISDSEASDIDIGFTW